MESGESFKNAPANAWLLTRIWCRWFLISVCLEIITRNRLCLSLQNALQLHFSSIQLVQSKIHIESWRIKISTPVRLEEVKCGAGLGWAGLDIKYKGLSLPLSLSLSLPPGQLVAPALTLWDLHTVTFCVIMPSTRVLSPCWPLVFRWGYVNKGSVSQPVRSVLAEHVIWISLDKLELCKCNTDLFVVTRSSCEEEAARVSWPGLQLQCFVCLS